MRKSAIYLALSNLPDDTRDILGPWNEYAEGARFWMKGIGEARGAVLPATEPQTCVVHWIHNSLDDASWNDSKLLAAALCPVFTAASAEAAEQALNDCERGAWRQRYPTVTAAWRRACVRATPFLAFPPEMRPSGTWATSVKSSHGPWY